MPLPGEDLHAHGNAAPLHRVVQLIALADGYALVAIAVLDQRRRRDPCDVVYCRPGAIDVAVLPEITAVITRHKARDVGGAAVGNQVGNPCTNGSGAEARR